LIVLRRKSDETDFLNGLKLRSGQGFLLQRGRVSCRANTIVQFFATGFCNEAGSCSMLKTISKFVLVAAVAATAVSFATPSFAAKKKAKAAAPAACVAPKYTMGACTNGLCSMTRCGLDGKWYPSLMMCWEPFCPKG